MIYLCDAMLAINAGVAIAVVDIVGIASVVFVRVILKTVV